MELVHIEFEERLLIWVLIEVNECNSQRHVEYDDDYELENNSHTELH